MRTSDGFTQIFASPGGVLPSTPRALAQELGSLLQRLGIPAIITDVTDGHLAMTDDAARIASASGLVTHRVVDVRLCGHTLRVATPAGDLPSDDIDLTPRQRAVVELIAQGLRNREIAERLGISLHTVRRHVEALLRRLNVPTRAAAAVLLRQRSRSAAHPRGPRRVA